MRKIEITVDDYVPGWFTNCWLVNIKYLEHEPHSFMAPQQLVKDIPAFGQFLSNRIQRIINESSN